MRGKGNDNALFKAQVFAPGAYPLIGRFDLCTPQAFCSLLLARKDDSDAMKTIRVGKR